MTVTVKCVGVVTFISFLTRPMAHVWCRAIILFRSIGGRLPRFPLCRLQLRLQATEQGRAHARAPRKEKKKNIANIGRQVLSDQSASQYLIIYSVYYLYIASYCMRDTRGKVVKRAAYIPYILAALIFLLRLHSRRASCCAYILAALTFLLQTLEFCWGAA